MKKQRILFVIVVLCCLFVYGQSASTSNQDFGRWVYRVVENPTQDDLNNLGLSGWELVTVTPKSFDQISVTPAKAYLKRRLR